MGQRNKWRQKQWWAASIELGVRHWARLALLVLLFLVTQPLALAGVEVAQYEGRLITAVDLVFEGSPPDAAAQADLLTLVKVIPNSEFSMVRVRDSLQALFDSGRVANARVEVVDGSARSSGPIRLRFVVKRQAQIAEIRIELEPGVGLAISTDEIRARLNLTQPGTRLTNQIVLRNADEIQVYLRDHGYFNAVVEHKEQLDPTGTRATVIYHIKPGEQARVESFKININGFDPSTIRPRLSLQPNSFFSREALGEDIRTIRQAIIDSGYLAPSLEEPRVERDQERNLISITLQGSVGPKVNVSIKDYPVSEKTKRELLPVTREGNIDPSAIVEGARRIRNRLQEDGYFFAEVTPICTVTPPVPELGENGTRETCDNLNPEILTGKAVEIVYEIDRGRRFRLTDIRITGTRRITYEDVAADLESQKASALGLIPFFGYGRGYTSLTLLEQDKRYIRQFMRDLGYRHAEVEVLQGVTLDGESLIITFNVIEGPLTRVAGVEIRGNKIYTEERLRNLLNTVVGAPYARSVARSDIDRMLALYARNGYVNVDLDFSVIELPKKGEDEQVRLVYWFKTEGDKVFINNIIINGVTGSLDTQDTKREAILRAISLNEGDALRADRLSDAERDLYLTDAFRQVIIRTEPAGETSSGFKKRDVLIDVEEKKPRVMDYGGGFSTDTGALGLLEIANVNLQNKLRRGAMRLRASRLQQLVRFEYIDPRFVRYNQRRFAPLTASVSYQRDSTVTRFFRSAIDRGTMGIVQRVDEDGNPIDEFGSAVDEPTINRFTAALETQRILDRRTRTVVFGRYSYEDVRLFNLESLLLKPILQPDRAVRLSRLGVSLVRDTRERCERGLLPSRPGPDEEPGRPGEICRYNQLDATRGAFLALDYSVALRQLGGNISYHRFQANYRRYYKLDKFRGTVLAGNITLGLANIFNPRDRDDNGSIDEIDLTLPISERFFAGGSTTLRGFRFEEAGPRQVIIPEGEFRDSDGNVVFLNPFTVPVGGNALAVVNLEARIPLTRSVQAVPFYDGGNVYRRVGDLFGKSDDNEPPPANILEAINRANLKVRWSHTVGLGFRFQTPFGGALAVDYGFLLNPPSFLIPQKGPNNIDFTGTPAIYRLGRTQLHFRFSQTF